jgi:glycosyltransferase involved in cell wall biosynthesis
MLFATYRLGPIERAYAMRIGIYLGDFAPDVGGGFTFQDEVFRAFASVAKVGKHKYVALGSAAGLEDYVRAVGQGMEVCRVESSVLDSRKESLKSYSPLLRRLLGVGPIEKVCVTLGIDCLWYVGGGAFEATDTPYVATVWDLQHRMTPWFPEMSAAGIWDSRELAYRRFLQRASYIITGTDVGRRELALNYGVAASRVRCLPHPTPTFVARTSSAEPGVIQKLGLQQPFLLYPGQFWAHKNHIGLLYALAVLRDRHQVRPPLVLTGSDKGNTAYVKETAERLDLSGQVVFTGFVTQQELAELYRGAAMMVYASFCGPENLPPLEAFALGCPVVAADVPGASEQLGEAALLFDPLCPEDMAAKIRTLLAQPERREDLREKGLKRAAAWTVGDFAVGMINLFDEFALYRRSWPAGRSF